MGQLGSLSPQGSIALGILVGLISTSVQSLGLTLQRKSHILEDEKAFGEPRRPPYRRRRWQLGMGMFIISNLAGSTIQITTLPLPVLSTLQASGLVFNTICATLILGEPFTRWSFGGTILVCAGAVLIAIFGAIGEPAHDLDQLLELLGRRQFVLWMIGQAVLVVATIAGAKAFKYLNSWRATSPRVRLFRGLAYGAVSGILSAHSLLVAKSAVELLVRTIADRQNQFNRWQSWAILACLVGLALSQLYYLHRGLKLCSTSILYPFVFCVYNIIAILDGLIYFHETSLLSVGHALLIALGTVILLMGVLALSWRLGSDSVTRPPVPQNTLTPGLGFVDDESDSEAETMANTDEEAGKESSDLVHHRLSSSLYDLRTPSPKDHGHLKITRPRRKRITEDIWAELEDEDPFPDSPLPFSRVDRRASMPNFPAGRLDSPRLASVDEDDNHNNNTPTESTALLGRSQTGRLYRDNRHRRRRSTALSGLDHHHHHHDHRSRRTPSVGSQEALGGWWRMKWWKDGNSSRRDKDKGKDRAEEDDDGKGGGNKNDGDD